MNTYLFGHKKSKKLIGASSWLVRKYWEQPKDIFWCNYGNFRGVINVGLYREISKFNRGVNFWSRNVAKIINDDPNEFLILGLDDYLLACTVSTEHLNSLMKHLTNDDDIICAKLSFSPNARFVKLESYEGDVKLLSKEALYKATTQWSIWRKDMLLSILKITSSPWDFELTGSKVIDEMGWKVITSETPPFLYCESSALSNRHKDKINIFGIRDADITNLIRKGLLSGEELIYGQWIGEVANYQDGGLSMSQILNFCPKSEFDYHWALMQSIKARQSST